MSFVDFVYRTIAIDDLTNFRFAYYVPIIVKFQEVNLNSTPNFITDYVITLKKNFCAVVSLPEK